MSDIADLKLLELLLALIPGFLTAEIVGALVLRQERSPLDRVIQALIYTFLSHLLWGTIGWWLPDRPGIHLVGLGLCAVFWGLLLTWLINTGMAHRFLRKMRLTRTASRPNEWYDAFYRTERHVVLHLNDGRRLFGWPLLYPQRPDRGHVFLTGAEWLDRPEGAPPCPQVDFLIDVSDVRFVEFLPPKDKDLDEHND